MTEERLRSEVTIGTSDLVRGGPGRIIGVNLPDPWKARARRYRREVADYCELCWYPGPRPFLWGWIGDRLEVHHRDGRHPDTIGHEADHQLQTLCRTCHRAITNRHQARGRREGVMNGRNPLRYAQIIREVTDATRPRYLRRGWHWFLYGRPDVQT